jgi:methylated-DNA-protein-cysteine methyltransferase-like protein
MALSPFAIRVREAVGRLRSGELVTYGEIAVQAGRPGAARAVGRILAQSDGTLPWWRVVTSTGRLVPGHELRHAELLAAEGWQTVGNRVRS